MNGRKSQIGFSQRIRLEWFEQTANLILAGNDKAIINDTLQDLLQDKVSVGGKSVRGNREKAITILLKTWLTVPRELDKLRDEGLEILQDLRRQRPNCCSLGYGAGSLSLLGHGCRAHRQALATSRNSRGSACSATGQGEIRRT